METLNWEFLSNSIWILLTSVYVLLYLFLRLFIFANSTANDNISASRRFKDEHPIASWVDSKFGGDERDIKNINAANKSSILIKVLIVALIVIVILCIVLFNLYAGLVSLAAIIVGEILLRLLLLLIDSL